jgi:hypothetical protein
VAVGPVDDLGDPRLQLAGHELADQVGGFRASGGRPEDRQQSGLCGGLVPELEDRPHEPDTGAVDARRQRRGDDDGGTSRQVHHRAEQPVLALEEVMHQRGSTPASAATCRIVVVA